MIGMKIESNTQMSDITVELNLLRDQILLLGGEAERAISRAVHALVERDLELAEAVIVDDDDIDLLENQIDEHCTELLSVATAEDTRFVLAIARAATIIERVADHAVNIAKHALALIDEPQLRVYIDMPRLAEAAKEMLIGGLDALTQRDCALARQIIRKDDEADELFHRIRNELIGIMERDAKTVRRAVDLLFIAKHLERIADYATNICELVIYMVEGRVIKHTQEAY